MAKCLYCLITEHNQCLRCYASENVMKEQAQLFPKIEPYNTGTLSVSELHTLFYEEVGNPRGKPALFLHGGPGVGILPDYRRFFDPQYYRVILLAQRGAGSEVSVD